MFILLIDLLRLRTWIGYKQRILLAMTSFRGFRVMIRQPTIRDLMTALIKTVGPVSTVFLLGKACLPESIPRTETPLQCKILSPSLRFSRNPTFYFITCFSLSGSKGASAHYLNLYEGRQHFGYHCQNLVKASQMVALKGCILPSRLAEEFISLQLLLCLSSLQFWPSGCLAISSMPAMTAALPPAGRTASAVSLRQTAGFSCLECGTGQTTILTRLAR